MKMTFTSAFHSGWNISSSLLLSLPLMPSECCIFWMYRGHLRISMEPLGMNDLNIFSLCVLTHLSMKPFITVSHTAEGRSLLHCSMCVSLPMGSTPLLPVPLAPPVSMPVSIILNLSCVDSASEVYKQGFTTKIQNSFPSISPQFQSNIIIMLLLPLILQQAFLKDFSIFFLDFLSYCYSLFLL